MATIDQRGPYQFRASVRRRTASGTVTVSETFETRKEASDWAAIQDGKVIGDEYVDRTAIRQMTVRQSCEWFLDRIAPMNRTTGKRQPKSSHAKNQASCLQYWMKSDFADWSLVSLGPWDLIDWRDEILDSGEISAQTAVHRLNALSQVYINISLSMKLELTNPVAQKVRPSLGPGRDRRLDPEPDASGRTEEQRLLAACDAGSRPWLRPAVTISLETAMRQSELAGLTWDRVRLNVTHPYCDLPFTKNERPRRVPLSTRAVAAFRELRPADLPPQSKARVFPVETSRAIGHAWRAVVTETDFPDLRWHDLRHEAISRLFERTDLRDNEIMVISGHMRPEMLTRYTHLRSDRLAARLG